jgi:hypothetical protein
MRDASAAIMADDCEAPETEAPHHLDHVLRHRALRIVDVTRAAGRLA